MHLIRFNPQAEHASRWWWQILFPEPFLSFRSVKKKGLKRPTKGFTAVKKSRKFRGFVVFIISKTQE